jgi:SAM-dependent methyltransferase
VVLDALGPCEGLRVLDAGCGEGYLARELARRGSKVTGLDTSSALINAGRGEAERLGLTVEHYVASIESIPGRDHTFDAVVCNHVMTGVNDPAAALKEIGRVTKPRGRIVILMLHPCFYTGNTAGRGGRDLTPDVYFGVRSMAQPFNVAGIKSPGEAPNTLWPLEHYISALLDAGFVLTGLSEPHPSDEQLRDQWWRENFTKPLFLLLQGERR